MSDISALVERLDELYGKATKGEGEWQMGGVGGINEAYRLELMTALVNAYPALRQELESLRRDAGRWRGLEMLHPMDIATVICGAESGEEMMAQLAKCVDTAIAAQRQGGT